jgi:hypothetical protein
MRLKKQDFKCAKCDQAVSQPHPACNRCKRQMIAQNSKDFMDYVSIHKLREHEDYDDFYVFNLSVGLVSIRGLTYNRSRGSIRFPKCQMNGNTVFPVKAFGIFVNNLRTKLDREIAKLLGGHHDAEDESREASTAA